MTLYTPHQLVLILLLVVAAGAGLAIDHWRRARPELVERLERVDRMERATPRRTSDGDAAADDRAPRSAAAAPRRAADRAAPPAQRAARGVRPAHDATGRPPRGPSRAATTPQHPLDVNRASVPELAGLPGIGTALAARIVEARPFAALDELARVRGLRAAVLVRVRPMLTATP